MSKRWILLGLALALCLGLAACGAREREETEQEERIVVGFSQTGSESDWRVANSESMRSVFTRENGYELIFSDAQQRQQNQISAILTFIQQEVDYIVFCPIVETGWEDVLSEAQKAGIPVIVMDRMIEVSDDSLYTAYVGSDFYAEGEAAGRWLESYLRDAGRDGEALRIVEIQGTAGSTAQIGRTWGFAAVQAEHENWELVTQMDGEFTTAKARELVEGLIAQGTEFDVLVCQNDNMATGAIDALEAAGIPCGGGEDEVLILSFDATRAGLEACLAGQIAFNAECNPLQGPYVEEMIRTLETGGTPPKQTYIEETTFDFETITREGIDGRGY